LRFPQILAAVLDLDFVINLPYLLIRGAFQPRSTLQAAPGSRMPSGALVGGSVPGGYVGSAKTSRRPVENAGTTLFKYIKMRINGGESAGPIVYTPVHMVARLSS